MLINYGRSQGDAATTLSINLKKYLAVLLICVCIASVQVRANSQQSAEKVGTVVQIALPVLAAATTLFHQDRAGFWQFTKSFAVTLAVTWGLKPLVNRKRPNGGKWSFPSGHTAAAFAGAAFMQRRYGWAYGVPAYTAAAFVGGTRIEAKRHWPTDVIAGAAIAVIANYIFTTPYRKLKVAPYASGNSVGLAMNLSY